MKCPIFLQKKKNPELNLLNSSSRNFEQNSNSPITEPLSAILKHDSSQYQTKPLIDLLTYLISGETKIKVALIAILNILSLFINQN